MTLPPVARPVERRPEHGAAGRAVPERHGVLGAAGLPHGRADQVLGINPIVTLEKQIPNMIGNLV